MNLAGKKIISIVVIICLFFGNSFGSMDISRVYAEEIISQDDALDVSGNDNFTENSESIEDVAGIVTDENIGSVENIGFSSENTVMENIEGEEYQIFIGGVVNDDRTINIWWDGVSDASVEFRSLRGIV